MRVRALIGNFRNDLRFDTDVIARVGSLSGNSIQIQCTSK